MSSIESTPHSIILSESLRRKPLVTSLFTSKFTKPGGFAHRLDQVRSIMDLDRTR